MKQFIYFDVKYLAQELKIALSPKNFIYDLFAGFMVATIAIPLCLAIAIASSAPIESGLIAAIIGGIVVAFLGGTRLGVTGPAIAMSVLVAECIHTNGISGLVIAGVICGILQIIAGSAKLSWIIKLIPLPVVHAFISAIGVLILLRQLPVALQLPNINYYHTFNIITHLQTYIQDLHSPTAIIAGTTIVLLLILAYIAPKIPALLIAVVIPTIAVQLFHIKHITTVGTIPALHLHLVTLTHLNQVNFSSLLASGIALFILCSMEALLTTNAIDHITQNNRIPAKINQELIGQGFANILSVLFGGIPVTGVIARSSVNIYNHAKTRLSAIIHALMIIAIIYYTPHIIAIIPIAVLAGILIAAAIHMINIPRLILFWQHDRIDVAIYVITFLAIISTTLITGVEVGIILTFIIVTIRLIKAKIITRFSTDNQSVRISLNGNIAFWSFDKLNELKEQIIDGHKVKAVIFEFDNLIGLDITSAKHLTDIAQDIKKHNILVIFHGMTEIQQLLFEAQHIHDHSSIIPYTATVTEKEIQTIFAEKQLTYSANDILKHGIEKFHSNYISDRKELINTLAKAQHPHTLLFTCADSRLDPNAFFSVRLGELFIIRNVGNVIPEYQASDKYSECAAIEFAINALGIRNIVICAHTECGAVKAAMNPEDTGYQGLDKWLKLIKQEFAKQPPHDADEGVKTNLLNQVSHLKTYPIVNELLSKNEITIASWVYDVHSAHILEYNNGEFTPI